MTAKPSGRAIELSPRVSGDPGEHRGVARVSPQVAEFLRGISDPGQIADMAGYSPDISFERKVEVLETIDVGARLEMVLGLGEGHARGDRCEGRRIRGEVSDNLEKRQREMILREQMAAIRKELGEEGGEDATDELRKKIDEAGMPDAVREQAERGAPAS